jgi:hypothetical protein
MNVSRVKQVVGIAVALAVFLAGAVPAAHAALARVGPVSNAPSIGGFPAWYQDTTGLALEFCDPKNASEVEGGWCLLLPPDVPVTPEVFPTSFFDEHFWFAAGAGMDTPGGGRALLVLAVEAAFATAVQPGDQVAFSRIRVVLNPVPVTGQYRIIHPYGEEIIDAVAGERIFITDDIGITCAPGTFDCALQSRLGPYLLPSATPGGAEMPPLTALNPTPDTDPAHFGGVFGPTPYPGTGKAYIADPARIGPVTGSPLGQNLFRIEGPAGSNLDGAGNNFIQTTDFSLMGRVFQGAIPSQVTVDRASYSRPLAGTLKVDVFASAFPAMQARLPAGPAPAVITPQLQFYDAACGVDLAGGLIAPAGTAHQMASPGLMVPPQPAPPSIYWGQSQPALIPPAVCVEHQNSVNANNQIVPVFFQANVTDQVFITAANYDPTNSGSLSVSASSSDEVAPPTLTAGELGDLTGGQFVLAPLAAPPARVRVFSSYGGSNEFQVTTGVGAAGGGNIPVAANDTATVLEDGPATSINILANDTLNGGAIPAGATITIVTAPLLGTATVNGAAIDYTPNPNANGTDGFTYRVTVAGQSSNIAAVTVTITPVNDAPVAANDTATAIANVLTPIDVLANDADPDGQANLAAPVNVTKGTSPVGSIWTLTVTGRVVNFTGNLPGTYTFTYQASDVAGAVSANTATVTVTVAAGETVTIQLAEFRTTNREWRISGVIAPTTSGTVTVRYANGPNAGLLIGTAPITAGTWSFRESGVTGLRDPRTGQASQIRVTGPAGGAGAVANISLRR